MHYSKYLLTKEAIKGAAASNATVIFETLIGSSEQYVLLSSFIYLRMLNSSTGLNLQIVVGEILQNNHHELVCHQVPL